ncbi:response regulator [Mucilaginibacter psychrotolerans]|uniref:Response regulator transcription factor n=1 Tax=Mucilaginibacter psychrotolerans TaxID=1524096 RepID=A0A4Y8SLN6_9SPHI|nr:response regulator transcription factor [Mucilaginibacter psychrotolerans]TFF39818.1 response regulator transcription factor [Mucilaginibacter psychrotolerans]
MINILLVDDHSVIRTGIRALLDKEAACKVVGEAADGLSVIKLLESGINAAILLIDISMKGMDGLELVENLKASYPQMKSIVLSAHDNEQYLVKAFRAGAVGYLLKSIGEDELIFAVKHVANNNQYISSQLASRFLARILTIPEQVGRSSENAPEFSEKELEVLGLIADGYTNQEIANKIFSGKRTIEGYRQSLIDKTGARNTAALIRFAVVNGIIN